MTSSVSLRRRAVAAGAVALAAVTAGALMSAVDGRSDTAGSIAGPYAALLDASAYSAHCEAGGH